MRLSGLPEGTRVFIDANIFIYHFSAASRFNSSCTDFLERVEFGAVHGVTSAAIVQETVHRTSKDRQTGRRRVSRALRYPTQPPPFSVGYIL